MGCFCESDDTSEGWSCTSNAPFSQAQAICASVGARLCTPQELRDSCASGTGCGHDRDMIWTSDEGVAGAAMLAFDLGGAGTTTDEPDIETTATTVKQDTKLESSSSTGDADSSNDGAIAGAILGTLGVVAVLAAVLYVRQQRQTAKQLEDGNSRHLSNPTIPALEPKLSLRTGSPDEEVFQVAPNGQSIQLEPVHTTTTAMPVAN